MGIIVRGIATGIGLVRESYENGKAKREKEKTPSVDIQEIQKSPSSEDSGQERKDVEMIDQSPAVVEADIKEAGGDKHDTDTAGELRRELDVDAYDEELPVYASWELDEAQDEVEDSGPPYQRKVAHEGFIRQKEIPLLAGRFAATYPLDENADMPKISCSVILPQRRPNSRKRGFIRAYSPILSVKGIDEACFLDFVETFNIASQANPLLYAINLASFSAHALAPGIGIAVAEAIRLAVDTGVELHSRYRTNEFLDKINKLWFLPRGLICVPMIWKPSVSSLVTSVAMDNVASNEQIGARSTFEKFRGGADTTRGNIHFPDAAPLVFPILDTVSESADGGSQTLRAKMKDSMRFTNDYFDRRARAKYQMKNPSSGLSNASDRPEFASRYSDPSHPAARYVLLNINIPC